MALLLWTVCVLVFLMLLLYRLVRCHFYFLLSSSWDENTRNPFSKPARKRKGAKLVTSQSERDKVLKQSFSPDKVPSSLDAIVVGSGIGGLSVAAILSKMGKKVLVLEQHDQAGGCCSTLVEKGFEFDFGIHYVGMLEEGTFARMLFDQISESGVKWERVDEVYDRVVLGYGEDDISERRSFPIYAGREKLIKFLVEKFPQEEKAIRTFFDKVAIFKRTAIILSVLKFLPFPIARLLAWSGLLPRLYPIFGFCQKTMSEVLDELTDNKELKAVLSYSYVNYGGPPNETSFGGVAMITDYYADGAQYPVGGSSEIAFNIIPTIEAAGGRVLVRAHVTNILMDEANQRVVGVTVKQGHTLHNVMSPVVVSNIGLFNTINSLVPASTVKKYGLRKRILSDLRHSLPLMSVYVGLTSTAEELKLTQSNIYAIRDVNIDKNHAEYVGLKTDDVLEETPPCLYISFPSAKDPSFTQRSPGKGTCNIITGVPYKWFEKWKDPSQRGQDYEDFKTAIAKNMWAQVVKLYPQLEGKVEYFKVQSPLSNIQLLNTEEGEVYGVDYNPPRYTMHATINMRPETGVPGLFLTGQDIVNCGLVGSMTAGLLCAMTITRKNLIHEMFQLMAQINREQKQKKD